MHARVAFYAPAQSTRLAARPPAPPVPVQEGVGRHQAKESAQAREEAKEGDKPWAFEGRVEEAAESARKKQEPPE